MTETEYEVSIHAPVKGATWLNKTKRLPAVEFQFTLP